MSNALLEAMAVGVACVASRVGGNPELIEQGSSGVLFEAGDAKTLANHLTALVLTPQWCRELGRNGRRRVEEHFSLHGMLSNYACLYEEILGARQVKSPVANYGVNPANIAWQPAVASSVDRNKAE
jgi:glycosyltransferase involved in cell wall biosynthesis